MQYPNYTFKPLQYPYLKKKTGKTHIHRIYQFISIVCLGISSYQIIHFYKDWIYNLQYWRTRRYSRLIEKQAYELLVQGNHPMKKSMIKQLSQF